MCKGKHEEHSFLLIRTNNGEWVSSENAIVVLKPTAFRFQKLAKQFGLPLTINEGDTNTPWIFQHEWEAVNARMEDKRKKRCERNQKIKETLDRVVAEKHLHHAKQELMNFGLKDEEAAAYIEQIQTSIPSLRGHAKRWLRGVARWSLFDFDITQPKECERINRLLYNLQDLPLMCDYDDNFNGQSPEEIIKASHLDIDEPEYHTPKDAVYTVNRVTFEKLSEYEGLCDWCILNEDIYNAYKQSGTSFAVAERSDWRNVPRCKGEDYPYDSYGMSLIAIGIKNGKIDTVTSRWNLDDTGDHYLTPAQLESLFSENFHHLGI